MLILKLKSFRVFLCCLVLFVLLVVDDVVCFSSLSPWICSLCCFVARLVLCFYIFVLYFSSFVILCFHPRRLVFVLFIYFFILCFNFHVLCFHLRLILSSFALIRLVPYSSCSMFFLLFLELVLCCCLTCSSCFFSSWPPPLLFFVLCCCWWFSSTSASTSKKVFLHPKKMNPCSHVSFEFIHNKW